MLIQFMSTVIIICIMKNYSRAIAWKSEQSEQTINSSNLMIYMYVGNAKYFAASDNITKELW